MKTMFNKTFIRKNKGCYTLKQVNQLSFINNKEITLKDIIKSEIPNKDKIWFIWNNCNFDYNKRLECYNQNEKIKNIFTSGRGFASVCYDFVIFSGTVGFYPKLQQNTILNEVYKFIIKNQ